jgi:uncharacterized protein (TIGR03083 family)
MHQLKGFELDVDRLATGLREATGAFADAVAGLDPRAPVPTCPEWRVRDLVGHIGQAHRWAAELVRTRAAAPVPDPRDAEPGDPRDWRGWLDDGAAELVGALLIDTGPETPVWTFLGAQPARFWLRRMLADTAVHLADAAIAAGRPFTIAPDLAAETISEGLGLISSAGAAGLKPELGELRGDGQTLQLRPADVEPGWLITREPGGVTWERRTADADVVVAAPVSDLLLVFSRRMGPDDARLTITGDRALVDHWWTHTAF